MEDIKYGQLWARYGELIEQRHLGTYRISFEGLKKAINEAVSARYPQPGAVWVKASTRLPGWGQLIDWRHNDKIPAGKDTVAGMTNRRPVSLHSLEWLDENGQSKEGDKGREMALAFAEWVEDNYCQVKKRVWVAMAENEPIEQFTTEQLWNQWDNQQNK